MVFLTQLQVLDFLALLFGKLKSCEALERIKVSMPFGSLYPSVKEGSYKPLLVAIADLVYEKLKTDLFFLMAFLRQDLEIPKILPRLLIHGIWEGCEI